MEIFGYAETVKGFGSPVTMHQISCLPDISVLQTFVVVGCVRWWWGAD